MNIVEFDQIVLDFSLVDTDAEFGREFTFTVYLYPYMANYMICISFDLSTFHVLNYFLWFLP